MPSFDPSSCRILGTGHYVPDRVLTNRELEKQVETSDAWIAERTGVRERRIAAEGQVTSDLALYASQRALEAAGVSPTELDLIIVATVSGDVPMPATAAYLQARLGAKAIPAFDLSAACAGFLFGLSIGAQFVRTGQARRVLLCGVELLSRIVNWKDRSTCILFGDGAGAVVLGAGDASRGVLCTRIATDGKLASLLEIPAGGSREPMTPEALLAARNKVHMVGGEVFKVAVRHLTASCLEALAEAQLTPADIDWVVAHQANQRILNQVAARLGLPLERFILNIERFGNTSSASIPIALDEAVRDGRIRPGHTVLMCALGAGIAWGSAIVRM